MPSTLSAANQTKIVRGAMTAQSKPVLRSPATRVDFSIAERLSRIQALLGPSLDIVAERVDDATVPEWSRTRGWSEALLGLSQADLERCEAQGLAQVAPELGFLPESLRGLAASVRELCTLPVLDAPPIVLPALAVRGVSARKREQLSALLGALVPLVDEAERIVDVGSGSGHFARLSAQHFGRETLGLERNPERVASARARAQAERVSAEFIVIDAGREPLALRAGDLAIGLHACGELGDTLVRVAAEQGCDLALVSCCLQKISGAERTPLSRGAGDLALRKETLGLSNLTSQAFGVETSIEATMLAREARYALRHLLRARGLELEPGAEMRGINRRRAHHGLIDLAERALGSRGLAPASSAELAEHEHAATEHYHAVRRLSLPRNLLARLVELSVVLDRAMRLVESGHAVRVAALFERAVTPRNISLFASRNAARLPALRGTPSLS